MNLNALERLARQALARKPPAHAGIAQYALTTAEGDALHSPRWQTAARVGRNEDGRPRDVVADNPDMGGWF